MEVTAPASPAPALVHMEHMDIWLPFSIWKILYTTRAPL